MIDVLKLAAFVLIYLVQMWITYKIFRLCWTKLRDGASATGTLLAGFVGLGCLAAFVGTTIFFGWYGWFTYVALFPAT